MRYRFAILSLFAVVPLISLMAASAPEPYGILELAPPPPKGETAEQYLKDQIEGQYSEISLSEAWSPEVRKLPTVAPMKDARPWLAKNLRVTQIDGGRRLRFSFRAGTRDERVIIINSFLRCNSTMYDSTIKWTEECIRMDEKIILELEQRITSNPNTLEAASYRKGIEEVRSIRIPERRTAIARLKQVTVQKWAR